VSTAASVPTGRGATRTLTLVDRAVETGIIGMTLFLFTEAMFFAGLVSAHVVLRSGQPSWPPPGQPRLPLGLTLANTVVLLASGAAVWRAAASFPERMGAASRAMAVGAILGVIFLAVQGLEWARLVAFGLTTSSGVYGATFYALVGAHAVHVLAALVVLLIAARRMALAARGDRPDDARVAFTLSRMFWLFVVGVWPVLYLVVYEPWR
jgi:heme/copper-type cytochrome/quinol oxidase subunit 3